MEIGIRYDGRVARGEHKYEMKLRKIKGERDWARSNENFKRYFPRKPFPERRVNCKASLQCIFKPLTLLP